MKQLPKKIYGKLDEGIIQCTVNELIDCIAEMQAMVTNLKGGYTDAEIKLAAFKPWPQLGDVIYRLNSRGQVIEQPWYDTEKQHKCRDFLGIYQTREEAEEKANAIRG